MKTSLVYATLVAIKKVQNYLNYIYFWAIKHIYFQTISPSNELHSNISHKENLQSSIIPRGTEEFQAATECWEQKGKLKESANRK